MPSSIDPGEIPVPKVDQAALFAAWHQLQAQATALRNAGTGMKSSWHGLAHHYRAPESGQLLGALDLPQTSIATVADDLDKVADALWNFAVEGGSAAKILKAAQADASALRFKTNADDDWDKDQDLIDQNNSIRGDVAQAVVSFMAAERTCANAIEGLVGGTQLHAQDKKHPNGYGPASIPENGKLPWGDPVAHNDEPEPWTMAWLTYQEGEVIKGVAIAAWGTIKGLVTLAEFGLTKSSRDAWMGVGTLAGAFGREKQLQAQLALGKSLIASDEWGTDPGKALGETLFNLGTLVVPGGAATKLGKLGGLGDLSKLGKVGEGGAISRTLGTIAKLRDGGNFGKLRIINGKIHIGRDVVIGKDGSAIIDDGLKGTGRGAHPHDNANPSIDKHGAEPQPPRTFHEKHAAQAHLDDIGKHGPLDTSQLEHLQHGKTNPVRAALNKLGLTTNEKGVLGEMLTRHAIHKQGLQIVGEQVPIRVNGHDLRADFLVRDSTGHLHLVESKYGNGLFSRNQTKVYPELERGPQSFELGKNAGPDVLQRAGAERELHGVQVMRWNNGGGTLAPTYDGVEGVLRRLQNLADSGERMTATQRHLLAKLSEQSDPRLPVG